jgi:hypothetical protein
MARAASPTTTPSRPLAITIALTATLLAFAGAGVWHIHIEPTLTPFTDGMAKLTAEGRLINGLPLKSTYTGVSGIDSLLSVLVIAFSAGMFWINRGVTALQIYFLLNCASAIAIWNIEACRSRNRWTLLSL